MYTTLSSLAAVALACSTMVQAAPAPSCSLGTEQVHLYATVSGKQKPLYVLTTGADPSNPNNIFHGLSTKFPNTSLPLSVYTLQHGWLRGIDTQYPTLQPFQSELIINGTELSIIPQMSKHPASSDLSFQAAPASAGKGACYLDFEHKSNIWYLCPNNKGVTNAPFIAYFASGAPLSVCNATNIVAKKA